MLVQTLPGFSGFHGCGQEPKKAALVLHDDARLASVATELLHVDPHLRRFNFLMKECASEVSKPE